MISSITRRIAIIASAALLALAGIALGHPAAAGGDPICPKNTVTIGNQGQVVSPPAQNQICDDDPSGLLDSAPVLGSLGLGNVF
jgi:hypothetical protein